MNRLLFLVAVCIFTLGASNCTGVKMRPDITPVLAAEANDVTVIVQGCGSQPIVGYTYCRVREGSTTAQTVTFMAPPIKCKTKPCIVYTVFYPNGEPSRDVAVPDGKTQVSISWKDLAKRDKFAREDRGFWPVIMTYRWIDQAGNEFQNTAEGEIRMRVLASQYVSLINSPNDTNLVWKWSNNGYKYGFSTAGRAYAGK